MLPPTYPIETVRAEYRSVVATLPAKNLTVPFPTGCEAAVPDPDWFDAIPQV